jgi:hypothetical protein
MTVNDNVDSEDKHIFMIYVFFVASEW